MTKKPFLKSKTDTKTSYRMKQVGRSKTSIERQVKSVLNTLGFHCRLNDPRLVGKPDIVLREAKIAIFVNGCFWHGHEACQKGLKRPQRNTEYWAYKIERNKARDLVVIQQLEKRGWSAITVWECTIRRPDFEERLKLLVEGANASHS